jgi:Arc/MetJ family transcription regulator
VFQKRLKEVEMRTNVDIDDELLEQAFSVSRARTKKELIHEALKEFVRLRKRKDLTELAGFIEFSENYNYKKARKTRI